MSNKQKLALVIGCGYSHAPQMALGGTVSDALNMKTFLKQYGYTVTSMNDDHYTPDSYLYPNKRNILREIHKLLSTAVTKNITNCVIFFAGHGIQAEFGGYNEADGKDEMIIPSDFYMDNTRTAIKDDELNTVLNQTIKNKPEINLFMMFDCCHSATNADLRYTYTHTGRLDSQPNMSENANIAATVVKLSGCLDSGKSFETEVNGQVQGILTSSFISAITKQPNLVTDIFLIANVIKPSTDKYGQRPRISSSKDLNGPNATQARAILTGIEQIETVDDSQSDDFSISDDSIISEDLTDDESILSIPDPSPPASPGLKPINNSPSVHFADPLVHQTNKVSTNPSINIIKGKLFDTPLRPSASNQQTNNQSISQFQNSGLSGSKSNVNHILELVPNETRVSTRINMFGPMAAAFSQYNELPIHSSYRADNATHDPNDPMLKNINISHSSLTKFLL